MSVALAATWRPRGELPRLLRQLPQFQQAYTGMVITLPPDVAGDIVNTLRSWEMGPSQLQQPVQAGSRTGSQGFVVAEPASFAGISVVIAEQWAWGRHLALQEALAFDADHVHYADLDRLLRWVETRPEEWRQIVEKISASDCLIIGRTEAAYRTHPQALVRTEEISNRVAAHLLGRPVDVSAGSKGFSRRAAEFLIAHSSPGRALGTDAEWPVLLQRAGYPIDEIRVDGLDWEIPDQYQNQAAGPERQSQIAGEYDADPQNWARRVEVALEIITSGLEASTRKRSSMR